jgi:tetratricopeptide (TPR) repeat protein
LGELESGVRQLLERYPSRVAYRCALGLMLCEVGRVEEARAEVQQLVLADIPEDLDWLLTSTLLADLYADMREAERAAELYEVLMPFESANVVVGFAAACEGPVSRLLGRLAAVTGRPCQQHFEQALDQAERLMAPAFVARTQLDYAEALESRPDLIDAAAITSLELGLTGLTRRAASLRGDA